MILLLTYGWEKNQFPRARTNLAVIDIESRVAEAQRRRSSPKITFISNGNRTSQLHGTINRSNGLETEADWVNILLGIIPFVTLAGFPHCREKASGPASFDFPSHRRCFLLDDRRRFRARKIAIRFERAKSWKFLTRNDNTAIRVKMRGEVRVRGVA